MKPYIDDTLITFIRRNPCAFIGEALRASGDLGENQKLELQLGWSNLFALLGEADPFKDFPAFDQDQDLFRYAESVLTGPFKEESIYELFDRLFMECLTEVKNLFFMKPNWFSEKISEIKKGMAPEDFALLSGSLGRIEGMFLFYPQPTMHDLTLFLAWDRICVHSAILFELPHNSQDFLEGINCLKNCLIESFQHITYQGKTIPSYFRLVEAVYAWLMREENLPSHAEEEWNILCQGVQGLRSRGGLPDVYYIDAALLSKKQAVELVGQAVGSLKSLSLSSAEEVKAVIKLAKMISDRIGKQEASWSFGFCPIDVFCLQKGPDHWAVTKVSG